MTTEQAIALAETRFWEDMNVRERALFQLTEPLMCMPFDVFHKSVEKALGRPVFTHEFGLNHDGLLHELLGTQEPPTMDEILNMIPAEKHAVIETGGGK